MRLPNHSSIVLAAAAVLLAVGGAAAQQTPAPLINPTGAATPPQPPAQGAAPAGALAPDASVDQVLDALDARGQTLNGFDGKVALTESDEGVQIKSTRTGRVAFQKKPAGDARMRVSFDQKLDGQKIANEKIDYLLDNGWLIDRDHQKRIEVKRQVLRPGEKVNLLKLGEGPFPLPIGQKKEEVKKQFNVTKVKPAKEDPPGTIHLVLRPIKGTQFAKRFGAIDVWVDTKTHFPRRIETLDPKETISRSTDLTDLRLNPELGDNDFKLPNIPADQWNIHEEPFRD